MGNNYNYYSLSFFVFEIILLNCVELELDCLSLIIVMEQLTSTDVDYCRHPFNCSFRSIKYSSIVLMLVCHF